MSCKSSLSSNCIKLVLHKDADETFSINIKDTSGLPIDVTGWSFQMDVRSSIKGDLLFSLNTASGISVNDPLTGEVTFDVSRSLTSAITQNEGYFDIRRVDADLKVRVIVPPNKVKFIDAITEVP